MADQSNVRMRLVKAASRAASKKAMDVTIHSGYMNLVQMIAERGDEYPSLANLDSYTHTNVLVSKEVVDRLSKLYNFPAEFKLEVAEESDRTCHWIDEVLFIYKDALSGGF